MSEPRPPHLYEQVKQHLLDRIAAGVFKDGEKIPSEYELMETLGASRMTVHRALREMSADGLLYRVQGSGTFVSKATSRSALLEIFDISDDIIRRGRIHRAHVLQLQAVRADAALANVFSCKQGAKIFSSEVLHIENGEPVQLELRYVSPRFAPHYLKQDFTAQTTNRYLQSIAVPTEVEHIVHAVNADARAQALLGIDEHEPCLLVERRTWTASGPATSSRLLHPGRRYSLGSRYQPSQMSKIQTPV